MRVAALYDVHGNLPALEAVLAEVEREDCDVVLVGGDVCAGPFPSECLALLRGLGERAFGSCLASKKNDEAIQAELKQGTDLGVTGTPAYFVNGRMLSGARPLESFTELIDSELPPAQGGSGAERR